jgi:HlyD family secretion protein
MKKKGFIVIGALLILGAVGYGASTYIARGSAGQGPTGRPVTQTVVGRETITTKVTAKGVVSLLNTQLVYANMQAEVEEVLVEKNDIVTEGQPILRYREKSKTELARQVERAKLDVTGAELALNSAKLPPSAASIEKAKMDVDNARTALERARVNQAEPNDDPARQQERITRQEEKLAEAQKAVGDAERLFQVGGVSQSDLDNAKSALIDAENVLKDMYAALEDTIAASDKESESKSQAVTDAEEALRYAELVYNDIVNALSEQSAQNNIKMQELALQRARLTLAELEQELADFQLELVSPISGTVTLVAVSRGEITPTNRALMEIADILDYVIKVDINERNAGKVAVGQEVRLTGSVLGEDELIGKVSKIGHIAETKQNNAGTERVIPVEITVDGRPDVLKPGFSLDAAIITSVRENAVAVPILATLSESGGTNYVLVIRDDNTLEKRQVTLGSYADMSVEVEGLREGERIVEQPTADMVDGTQVMVINQGAETEPAETVPAETDSVEADANPTGGDAQ